jgi:uncharacterized RDD family membrane protein YckC
MTPLKRIVAYAIDVAVIATPASIGLDFASRWLQGRFPDVFPKLPGMLVWGVSIAIPVLVLGILTGLTGWSPGKLVMFLRVRNPDGDPPGIAQGIVREISKAVALGFFFGMIYALSSVVTGRRTFYDEWLSLDVDDTRPYGLTETQKKWRKYQREQARRQAR